VGILVTFQLTFDRVLGQLGFETVGLNAIVVVESMMVDGMVPGL
jgi:hypothetical protein